MLITRLEMKFHVLAFALLHDTNARLLFLLHFLFPPRVITGLSITFTTTVFLITDNVSHEI